MQFDPISNEFISSLVGALVGAATAYFLTKNIENKKSKKDDSKSKSDNAFEFHREYNNSEFGNYRKSANNLIKSSCNSDGIIKDKIDSLEKTNPKEVIYLYSIMRFFQRLSIAHKYKTIDNELLAHMFQEPFFHWYYNYFENGLTDEWKKVKEDLDSLATCFKNYLINN